MGYIHAEDLPDYKYRWRDTNTNWIDIWSDFPLTEVSAREVWEAASRGGYIHGGRYVELDWS